jgi:hypothetical protein
MSGHILLVFIFTAVIHCIATLAYAVRLVGIKTGKIMVSLALFNILVLVSRTANSLQAPLLAKKIEQDIIHGYLHNAGNVFHWLILAASIGTVLGGLLIPTFHRLFSKFVLRFNIDRSVPKILIHGFSKAGIRQVRKNLTLPKSQVLDHIKEYKQFPKKLIVLNTVAVSILTVGVFSALYAAYWNPSLRATSNSLAPILNGFATILLVVFIDPYFSLLTDDVLDGKKNIHFFYRCLTAMVISRIAGTFLAQLLLFPATKVIVWLSDII